MKNSSGISKNPTRFLEMPIWQRSVFLAVFLTGVVSGYAIYFKDIFLNQFKTDLVYKYDYIIAIAIFGLVGRFADLSRR